MSKAGVKLSEIREQLMKDEEFRAEYEKLKPRYELISQIIEADKSKYHPRGNSTPCRNSRSNISAWKVENTTHPLTLWLRSPVPWEKNCRLYSNKTQEGTPGINSRKRKQMAAGYDLYPAAIIMSFIRHNGNIISGSPDAATAS